MPKLSSDFLTYLANHPSKPLNGSTDNPEINHLPSLSEMSKELGVSVALLREQLEVAKAIGFVEVRPRTGIRRLPFSFLPAVRQSLSYAIEIDLSYFLAYSDLRNHLEAAYWDEAARRLGPDDLDLLRLLVSRAWEKLRGRPIQIPHQEHRRLHLAIYCRLNNPFVSGLLEGYWEAYEAVGLNLYADYSYLQDVWRYHQQMVEAICSGDFDQGYCALVQHRELLSQIPMPIRKDDNAGQHDNPVEDDHSL